jgi:hypothetical protein
MTASRKTTLFTKLRRHGTTVLLAGAVALVSACAQTRPAPAAGQEPLVISQSTNAALQQYLAKIYPNLRGAFAVSPDGQNSFYVYCPDISCSPPLFGGIAQSQCHSLTGQECLLFFVARDPRYAYTVAPTKTPVGHHGYRRARPVNELPIFDR